MNANEIAEEISLEISGFPFWMLLINTANSERLFQSNFSGEFNTSKIKGKVVNGFVVGHWQYEEGKLKLEKIFIR